MKKLIAVLLLLTGFTVVAGTNNLPTETAGKILLQHVNKFKTALSGDIVPRDSSGNVTDIGADIGESSYRWLNGYIKNLKLAPSTSKQVTISADASTSASYTLTLPTSLPGSLTPLFVNSNGTVSTNLVAGNLTEYSTAGTYTWTAPTGSHTIFVLGAGAGGGGGGGRLNQSGGGGGCGSTLESRTFTITAGTGYTVVIGAGGTGGLGSSNPATAGSAGGDTSFNSVLISKGGQGGPGETGATGALTSCTAILGQTTGGSTGCDSSYFGSCNSVGHVGQSNTKASGGAIGAGNNGGGGGACLGDGGASGNNSGHRNGYPGGTCAGGGGGVDNAATGDGGLGGDGYMAVLVLG